jgi:hypothetical protein
MNDDDLATAISAAAERCTIALHDALTAEGVPTTPGNIYAACMVFSVTLAAAVTTPDRDRQTVDAFKQGLALFRADQADVRGMTKQ